MLIARYVLIPQNLHIQQSLRCGMVLKLTHLMNQRVEDEETLPS